jgi:hypothetical protein
MTRLLVHIATGPENPTRAALEGGHAVGEHRLVGLPDPCRLYRPVA